MESQKRALTSSFFALLVLAVAVPAWGQRPEPDSFLNQQRAVEEMIRAEREKLSPVTEDFEFDYGGFYSLFFFMFDDGVESSRTFRRHDLRVWTRIGLDQGAHEIFARGRLSFIDFNAGDQFDEEDDVEGMNLERGYYRFDLAKAMLAYRGERITDYNVRLQLGRDLVTFGTGYALSTTLDSVILKTDFKDIQLTWLAGKTVGSAQDFDSSRVTNRTRRSFLGLEGKYVGFERHEPFAYVLWQRDRNSDLVSTRRQEFDYDSFYAGIGSTGEIIPKLRYSTEWVVECGHSYSIGEADHRNNIFAWAWDIELEYLFGGKGRPRVAAQYMFASGDADRTVSPTNTVGGNFGDFTDSSFVGFGFRDTGLSFAPRLSNVHIWRGGASYFPFEDHPGFESVQVGTNWFLYHKHHSSAGVSDPTATVPSGYLGWEMDYFANWAITSDLSATARYGVFFPGKAFTDRTTRTYLLLGFTWNF